jgi:hypothetical protein
MSALGQKRRFGHVGGMSAHPPIAALKRTSLDVAFGSISAELVRAGNHSKTGMARKQTRFQRFQAQRMLVTLSSCPSRSGLSCHPGRMVVIDTQSRRKFFVWMPAPER